MDLVTPDIGLLFWTVVSFFTLFFLLGKFAWKPIVGAVNTREESIREALDSAEKARLEMQNLHADNERILKEARVERETMLKEAREVKTKMIEAAKEEAQTQANKIIEQAQVAIASEKQAAISELKSHVAAISIEIAQKVIGEKLSTDEKQMKFVDELLAETTLN